MLKVGLCRSKRASSAKRRGRGPVLRSVAVNVDAAGVAVEYGTTWFAGDRVTLTVEPE